VHSSFLAYLPSSISTCFGRLWAHHQGIQTVFMRHMVLVILRGRLSGMYTRQSEEIVHKVGFTYRSYQCSLVSPEDCNPRHVCFYHSNTNSGHLFKCFFPSPNFQLPVDHPAYIYIHTCIYYKILRSSHNIYIYKTR